MKLRKLERKDAVLMLEWMHDPDVVQNLQANFGHKTIVDCELFIEQSDKNENNLHRAIVSDVDEYMGTVSLKNIDYLNKNAEFAIVVRKSAMSRGFSRFGMVEMIRIAFDELNMDSVYWCVSRKNKKAIRFYDKHGFHETIDISDHIKSRYKEIDDLKWYSVLKGDDYQNYALQKGNVAGCQIVKIRTIPTVESGELSFFEARRDVPFDIKRVYYISKVPEGTRRGFHAHRKLKQLLFCPYGEIQLILDNGRIKEELTLCDPSIAVMIERPVWREMLWIKQGSVLGVAASEEYDSEDYIRNYEEFLDYLKCNH